MSVESLFRTAFWSVFGGMVVMQGYFASWAWQTGARSNARSKTIERDEGWGSGVFRAGRAVTLVAFLVVYAINPPWHEVLRIPMPDWLRWIGVIIGVASLAFYAWSRATLGKEWSSPLQVREQHRLVTTGPYAWVRHPIYSALMGFMTSITLITANWFLVVFLAVSIVDLGLRIPKEEQMMIDEFGDEYVAYMKRTGGLLPR